MTMQPLPGGETVQTRAETLVNIQWMVTVQLHPTFVHLELLE